MRARAETQGSHASPAPTLGSLAPLRASSWNEKLLRALVGGPLPLGVTRAVDNAWVHANDAFVLLTGYEPQELASGPPSLWCEPSAIARVTRALRRGSPVRCIELSFRHKDGHVRTVLATVEPLEMDGVDHALWMLSDITERKAAEARQRRAELDLERRQRLLAALNHSQATYLDGGVVGPALEPLLAELVALTGSGFGVVLEATRDEVGEVWLTSCAMTDLAVTADDQALLARHRAGGLVMTDLDTLPGRVVTSGRPVVIPGDDPAGGLGGLPPGHGPITAYLGLPLIGPGGEVVGALSLANSPDGYADEVRAFLAPALATCGSILHAQRTLRSQARAEAALRESEERFRLLVDGVRDYALVMLDPLGRYTSWNQAAELVTGYDAEESIGRHFARGFGEDAQQAREPELLLARAEREGRCESEGWRVRKDGGRYWATVTITPLHEGTGAARRLRGFALLMRDTTHKKQLERLKDEFVSTVSHELRTPLTAIRGALGLIHAGALGEVPAEAQEVIALARANCERLVRLVNDILDIEKIEAGKLELRRIAIAPAAVAARVLDGLRSFAGDAGVTLRLEAGADVRAFADEDRLEQVVTNLVSNAIKFSPPDGEVLVRVGPGEPGRVRLEVRDHGPGIPAEKLPLLFGKFQQLDGSDRRARGGSGLGLAIAKAIVEQHAGMIGVDSQPGAGSCFWFELPAIAAGEEVAS